ncbi:Tmeff2 [Phodopus roborovskii]|uniref:Tmeff2 protein n=1 Tax=Phodopus roborovskii TaxID=109678 RepID=A0AAU9ZJY5_PHORO|nr:Tmeff2 [Phodopus roborovskii]
MVLWESPRQCSSWTLCEGFCWLLLLPVTLLIIARPVKLAAFPTSLSDCQTPTGWNCSGFDDRENDLFLCDTNTCKFDGECLRIGDTVTCVCQFKCNSDYVPVCGSNGESYQNECYLRQAACKQQSEILVVSEGSCATGSRRAADQLAHHQVKTSRQAALIGNRAGAMAMANSIWYLKRYSFSQPLSSCQSTVTLLIHSSLFMLVPSVALLL